MRKWQAVIRYVSERVIEVEAETEDDARRKLDSGQWSGERERDFYMLEEVSPPTEVPRRGDRIARLDAEVGE